MSSDVVVGRSMTGGLRLRVKATSCTSTVRDRGGVGASHPRGQEGDFDSCAERCPSPAGATAECGAV
ncbi:MAG: hypothetical protein ABR540_21725 [Acidimicrobiales bacterium]